MTVEVGVARVVVVAKIPRHEHTEANREVKVPEFVQAEA